MKINGMEVVGDAFAYNGCHKIYILESQEEANEAIDSGYYVFPLYLLESKYADSCWLRFINNWSLDKTYCPQGVDAKFED